MQIQETSAEGLVRQFRVTIPAKDLDARLDQRLADLKERVHLKGFRKGKVPLSFLKKAYGKGLMPEVIQETVSATTEKALSERDIKAAIPPKIDFEGELDAVVKGEKDLSYTMHVEVMPTFEVTDLKAISLVRPVADVPEEDIEEALKRLADQARTYTARGEGEAAEEGDQLIIDFVGRIDGKAFDGGSAEGATLVLGQNRFIPGFEEQLVGAKAGEERVLEVTFPEEYGVERLAGKQAEFTVQLGEVKKPDEVAIDDELAKRLGLESLAKLRETLAERFKADFARQSRSQLKRRLLDALDERHSFDLPPGMVEAEFAQIWRQVQHDIEHHGYDLADEGKTEDELKAEYRRISERRVRLGLVLADVGQANSITVSQDELTRALTEEVRRYPGQAERIYEYYRRVPEALAQLRAPIFEEKVVDFILELADVKEEKVSKEELFKEPDDELPHAHGELHHHHHDHDHDHDDHDHHDHEHDHDHVHDHDHDHEDESKG